MGYHANKIHLSALVQTHMRPQGDSLEPRHEADAAVAALWPLHGDRRSPKPSGPEPHRAPSHAGEAKPGELSEPGPHWSRGGGRSPTKTGAGTSRPGHGRGGGPGRGSRQRVGATPVPQPWGAGGPARPGRPRGGGPARPGRLPRAGAAEPGPCAPRAQAAPCPPHLPRRARSAPLAPASPPRCHLRPRHWRVAVRPAAPLDGRLSHEGVPRRGPRPTGALKGA